MNVLFWPCKRAFVTLILSISSQANSSPTVFRLLILLEQDKEEGVGRGGWLPWQDKYFIRQYDVLPKTYAEGQNKLQTQAISGSAHVPPRNFCLEICYCQCVIDDCRPSNGRGCERFQSTHGGWRVRQGFSPFSILLIPYDVPFIFSHLTLAVNAKRPVLVSRTVRESTQGFSKFSLDWSQAYLTIQDCQVPQHLLSVPLHPLTPRRLDCLLFPTAILC